MTTKLDVYEIFSLKGDLEHVSDTSMQASDPDTQAEELIAECVIFLSLMEFHSICYNYLMGK